MTKLKKTYCILSLIFAIAVFVAVLFASQNRTTVYAASMDPDSIDSLDNTAANTSTGSGSESDSKGGLSISINNDEAGVASEVRALLLLTIIAVSPSLLIMLTSYTRIVIVLKHILNAVGAHDIGDLVGVGDDGGRAVRQRRADEFLRRDETGFQMDVRVDEAGADDLAGHIVFDLALIAAEAHDQAVRHGDIARQQLIGEYVDIRRVFQHQIGLLPAGGGLDHTLLL